MEHGVTGLVVALIFTALALPPVLPATAAVRMARAIRVPCTDHHGVLANIEFT